MSHDICHKCGKPAYKTDGEGKPWCTYCLGLEMEPPKKKPIRYAAEKPKRNEPCWCGSGKKFKKCHWG